MARLLIAEDEARISSFLDRGLRAAGYGCTVVAHGERALEEAQSGIFDLMLLDVGLPGMDGFEVLTALRRTDSRLPVIILTARHSVEDVVRGLDGGANDYLTKPFKFDELLSRVRLRLREKPGQDAGVLSHGTLRVHQRSRRVLVDEVLVALSAREFALAVEFLRHPDQVLSREQLLARVWGEGPGSQPNVVGAMVSVLRSKFGADLIETVRGVGYRLR